MLPIFKLKLQWIISASIVLAVAIYWTMPTPPPTCQSLQRFGAVEINGRCVVDRSIKIEGNVNKLPDRLTVKGDLNIYGSYVTELPVALIVEGNLDLYKTSIGKIPPDLQVGRSLTTYLGFGSPEIRCQDIPKTAVIKMQGGRCGK
jgi:hypothetical protein